MHSAVTDSSVVMFEHGSKIFRSVSVEEHANGKRLQVVRDEIEDRPCRRYGRLCGLVRSVSKSCEPDVQLMMNAGRMSYSKTLFIDLVLG